MAKKIELLLDWITLIPHKFCEKISTIKSFGQFTTVIITALLVSTLSLKLNMQTDLEMK